MQDRMLLDELETLSHNRDTCDSEIDRSDNEYVPSEHSDKKNVTICLHLTLILMEIM
jgi:hypothetical protein